MTTVKINVRTGPLRCPVCGACELHHGDVPPDEHGWQTYVKDARFLIRAYKVGDDRGYWWSQCLVCSGLYDSPTGVADESKWDRSKGWF